MLQTASASQCETCHTQRTMWSEQTKSWKWETCHTSPIDQGFSCKSNSLNSQSDWSLNDVSQNWLFLERWSVNDSQVFLSAVVLPVGHEPKKFPPSLLNFLLRFDAFVIDKTLHLSPQVVQFTCLWSVGSCPHAVQFLWWTALEIVGWHLGVQSHTEWVGKTIGTWVGFLITIDELAGFTQVLVPSIFEVSLRVSNVHNPSSVLFQPTADIKNKTWLLPVFMGTERHTWLHLGFFGKWCVRMPWPRGNKI